MSKQTSGVSHDHILITGVTGYIGFKTLTTALERGFRVRAVVRSESNVIDLTNKIGDRTQLEFIVIPDFSSKDAFFNALDGIDVVIHIASPLAKEVDDYDAGIIQPTIAMVTTVLEAANRVASVRRVILTSSCVTLIPFDWNMKPDSERLYSVTDINTSVIGPFSSAMGAYWASKALSRAATTEFVLRERPHFDFVNLLPSVVVGPDDRLDADSNATIDNLLEGTKAAVLAPALDSTLNSTFPYVGTPVHVSDVARAHVDAIDAGLVPGNSEFILSSNTPNGVNWDTDVRATCRKYFQEEVNSKILPLEGSLTTIKWRLDAQRTEEVFGWRFTNFGETMRGLISQYLKLKIK
ncbi:hypothetical protein N7520_003183 [Penicillium odoratum]|uniref:uncharacterized protein n=1 Tax=Penicillium odoratum TaxID=1167516 RepID=UPI002547B9ED|nr:uncharacterized protein N7520_003183 [Penicillium odoratum]KAJ5772654.1 hypothetical protein N7520_003183 [Penicillium odoratum]